MHEFDQIVWLLGDARYVQNAALIQADPSKVSDPRALEELKRFL